MDSDMALTELQEHELPEAIVQEDEDDVEELRNSLREVVQDQSVKPKLQCLMVDPSFSMVTVQSEDSGIVWETASSRCSTPWASEASYSSDTYSLDGSATGGGGAQGKITIVFDEDKIVRRRKRMRGKARLGERLRRPGSSRSGSTLGVERPEMAEVSVPNIRVESVESDTESGEVKDKEQELFSLISEGYEILNIKVPSKLPTVDEEESTELQDNLSYLEETPRIRSKSRRGSEALPAQDYPEMKEVQEGTEGEEVGETKPSEPTEQQGPHNHKDGTSDMDYFEAFTLLDEVVPGQQVPEPVGDETPTKPQREETNLGQMTATDSLSAAPDDDFVFVTDMEIASERLDEVFYGNKHHAPPEDLMKRGEEDEEEGGKEGRRESLRSLKESGSALFGREESILTPIFLSPGPPKIIDPILLEEPTAMSFLYSDLYEDAMGERRRSDEEGSEAESVGSDRSFQRRLSDSEETDGYLEKFILKDETPNVEDQSEEVDGKGEGLMMWSQSKFELTGFLTRVVEEEEEKEECKKEEIKAAEMNGYLQPAGYKEMEESTERSLLHIKETGPENDPESVNTDSKVSQVEKDHLVPGKKPEKVDVVDEAKSETTPEAHESEVDSQEEVVSDKVSHETELLARAEEVKKQDKVEVSRVAKPVVIQEPVVVQVNQVSTESKTETVVKASEPVRAEDAIKDPTEAIAGALELHRVSQKAVTDLSVVVVKVSDNTKMASEIAAETINRMEMLAEAHKVEKVENRSEEPVSVAEESFTHNPEAEVVPTAPPAEAAERWASLLAPAEGDKGQEKEPMKKQDLEGEDEWVFTPLRSFAPQEDLSELHRETVVSEMELHRETAEELEYEIISQQEAREMMVSETERKRLCPGPNSNLERERELEKEKEREMELERERKKQRLKEEERQEREERERQERGRQEKERQMGLERERERERERLRLKEAKERQEKENKERKEKERQERERLIQLERERYRERQGLKEEKERQEREKQERERQAENEREKERLKEEEEKERHERKRQMEREREKERQRLKEEKERQVRERTIELERERERERLKEEKEKERQVKERQERDRHIELERKRERERQRLKEESEEKERQERERERERQRLKEEKERQERERQMEKEREKDRQRLQEEKERQEKEKERQIELERERENERQRLKEREEKERQERERQMEFERERQKERQRLKEREEKERQERERQMELEREREKERQRLKEESEEKERQEREREKERQRLKEERQERERHMEKEREKDRQRLKEEKERQEKERQIELERERENERQRLKEREEKERQERERQMELEREREREMLRLKEESEEKERQVEREREKEMQRLKEEKERQERERERERQRLKEESEEKERQMEKEREKDRQRLKEEKERQEKERQIELERERENERQRLKEREEKERQERERQMELERERDIERQRLKEREEKERQERERQMELERETEKERERQRLKEESEEKERQERERQMEREREKGRQRLKEEKERQLRAEKERHEREEKERERELLREEERQEREEREQKERERDNQRLKEKEQQERKSEMELVLEGEKQKERVRENLLMDMERQKEREMEERVREERGLDLPAYEEPIEADYEIFDAEEESQARAAAALQGMDCFCLGCGCLLSETDRLSGGHQDHEVTSVETAYEDIRERLSEWISELQERSENIEDLVSELELGYNTVEDHCRDSEEVMEAQNEEMMALVMDQYNTMSLSMEEEKKAKLEQLYDQIVSFQESIDQTKVTLDTTAREADIDPDTQTSKDIYMRLTEALQSAMSLELGPRGLLVFEDYAKGNAANTHTRRKGIPVPQKPSLQPQECASASSTSVTVYWRVNPGDIIDCFQVYCMEDPQGAVSDEYRVTVKESYCVLEELEPDKVYKVWVMAVNYTGCSLPSERLPFRTAPSVPVIDTGRCTILWDSATLRWNVDNQTPMQSYTLEYCRQYALEGEGLRSISGIQGRQQRVLLHPNENYLFYIKAVNKAGASEQSEAALISTRGTRFHLLKASAHPVLKLSEDQTTLYYPQDTYTERGDVVNECPSVLGELLPMRGHHYWETNVTRSSAYRVGVAYETANRDSLLGENSTSWCLHCVPTPYSCRFELLHGSVQSDVFVGEVPSHIGTLLDYKQGRLSFYNTQRGQLLGTLTHCFTQPCHPVLGMEQPGSLKVSMALEVADFAKHS